MALTTISIPVIAGYPLSGATLTSLTRLDTDASVDLPDSVAFALNDDEDAWEIEADLPAGVDVAWEADVAYEAGGTSGADGVVTAGAATQAGTYWTWDGVKNILGEENASIASQMDNGTTEPDLSRVAADGTIADAYVNRRVRLRGLTVPLTSTAGTGYTADYPLVEQAANLLTAGLLIDHRDWFTNQDGIARDDEGRNEWTRKGQRLLDDLFGADPGGIDGEVDDTADDTNVGTFQAITINRGTTCCTDEYSDRCC